MIFVFILLFLFRFCKTGGYKNSHLAIKIAILMLTAFQMIQAHRLQVYIAEAAGSGVSQSV